MQTKRIISAITAAAILATAVSMPTWAEDTAGIDSDGKHLFQKFRFMKNASLTDSG